MRTITTAFLAASLLVGSLFACGGGETPPPATPEKPAASASAATTAPAPAADAGPGPTASATPTVKEPETPKFNDLPKDKKVEIMMSKVVPNVGKDLKDFDAKRFANFGCATCHGPKKNQDPHQVLPKLTMSGGGMEKMQKKEIFKVMAEKVTPDMAAALGEKPYDPATKTGFGCGGCHEVK